MPVGVTGTAHASHAQDFTANLIPKRDAQKILTHKMNAHGGYSV